MTAEHAFDLRLADVPFAIRVRGALDPSHVVARFGAYFEPPRAGESPVRLSLEIRDDAEALPQPMEVEWPGAHGAVAPGGHVQYARRGLSLVHDVARGEATAIAAPFPPELPPVVDPTPLDAPLRLLLTHTLRSAGGAIVHACGYADARGAILFAGESGAGKTTTGRKLPAARVLSDDQVAIRPAASGWVAHSLPFVGELAIATRRAAAPLRAIALLARGGTPARLTPERGAGAVVRVLGCLPWYVSADARSGAAIDIASDLVGRRLVHRLALGRDTSVDDALDALLA